MVVRRYLVRIDRGAANLDLIMQVVAGRLAAMAHETEHFPLHHTFGQRRR